MKASKIRIVVILLLIIFFGLLILFGSRNIYEGIKTATVQTTPVGGSAPAGTAATIYNSGTKTTTFASTDLITVKKNVDASKIDNNSYFMKVYYYLPKKTEYSGTKLPISHIYHNLPSCFKVSFTNIDSEKFGPSTDSDNIFIQGPSDWDKKIGKCYKEFVNQNTTPSPYTFKNLVDDINSNKVIIGKADSNLVVKPISKSEMVIDIPKNSNDGKGTKLPANPSTSLPSASLTYAKISNTDGIKFNGTYDANSGSSLVSGITDDVAGKSINLVTFYLNFNSLPSSCN